MTDQEFEAFYDRHWKYVYRLCYTYMKCEAEAEDCTEDVFVKVLTGSYSYEDEVHERKWLTLVAINLCKDRLKSCARKNVVPIDEFDDFSVPLEEERFDLLAAVRSLPDKYKDVIWLFYYDGYATEEIAALLERPPSTIRNQLSDARKLLRRELEGGKS